MVLLCFLRSLLASSCSWWCWCHCVSIDWLPGLSFERGERAPDFRGGRPCYMGLLCLPLLAVEESANVIHAMPSHWLPCPPESTSRGALQQDLLKVHDMSDTYCSLNALNVRRHSGNTYADIRNLGMAAKALSAGGCPVSMGSKTGTSSRREQYTRSSRESTTAAGISQLCSSSDESGCPPERGCSASAAAATARSVTSWRSHAATTA